MASLIRCPKCHAELQKEERASVLVCPGCQAKLKLKPAPPVVEPMLLATTPAMPDEAPLPSKKKKKVRKLNREQRGFDDVPTQIRSKRPVGQVCPKCQSDRFQKINADNFMSLWPHRYCTDCGTKYRLPLSKKGRMAFFATGLLTLLLCPLALYGIWNWMVSLTTVKGDIYTTKGTIVVIVLVILFLFVLPFACFYYAFAKDE